MNRNLASRARVRAGADVIRRAFNFGAGPAMLPTPVLEQAQAELLDWRGTGMSVMEISHRSSEFEAIAAETEDDLRATLGIPDHYRVLFLQGGATSQFAMVPLNLLRGRDSADYLHTGHWSGKALAEARRYCRARAAASSAAGDFRSIPPVSSWSLNPGAAYVYYCANETIRGVEFHSVPETGAVPLVADMTSDLLTRPLDVARFGLVFASAQKNLGPAGLTIVIVREDLIGHAHPQTPGLYDYALHARERSMANTPPTFAWYMAGLVLKWLKREGGVAEMERRSRRRAEKLYAFIDTSGLYRNDIDPACRSRLNVTFRLADATLEPEFLREAAAEGLTSLAGHRSVGGLRASLYNAMPEAGVEALIEFMREFERRHG